MLEAIYDSTLKTGWIFLPMFLLGLLGWYYIIQIWIFSQRERKSKNIPSLYEFETFIRSNNFETLSKKLENERTVTHLFLRTLIRTRNKSLEYQNMRTREVIVRHLLPQTQGLTTVGVVATVAPLFGLLGTVSGMITTFYVISFYGSASPVLMAAGISEALLATQGGLAVAFPLMFFHSILRARMNKIRQSMEAYHDRYSNILSERKT